MAKIHRKKNTLQQEGKEINLESGDVTATPVAVWSIATKNYFDKCVSLVEQIKNQQLNVVDETNIATISHSLAVFGEKGKNLFNQLCLFQNDFGSEQLVNEWRRAVEKHALKTPFKFIQLCREKGLQVKINEDEGWEYKIRVPGQSSKPFTDELTENDGEEIREFGFIERENCYYFAEYNSEARVCTLVRKSNFILRILFHINRGKQNKRVIEMVNIHGRKVTNDIETKQLTSFQAFKELTEGHGNFIFHGTNIELSKIKDKLFNLEKPSQQIDMLGWNKQGKFFAFSNGLYTTVFNPVDEHGIVTLDGKNYFIQYHPGTDEYLHINEKKFSYKVSLITFEQWSELYCRAFGKAGEVALIFGIATLMSDIIFAVRGNFPMLQLYGEGGSGKSRVGINLQHLWGEPQPPLKLSEKANTDKSKIRKMAQYTNAMCLFEEFINELDTSIIKTISGIYDRFGYERSNLDSKYGTETVPINSTAMITGNSYPNDDPLMQRIILIDYNANRRDQKVTEAFDKLTELSHEGITEITGRILQLRPAFKERWEKSFRPVFDDFKKEILERGIEVPDRMIENYAVIISSAKVLADIGLKLPFRQEDMVSFLVDTIRAQAEKRDTGSVIQKFWHIVLQLASQDKIQQHREYTLSGNVVSIRFTEIHGLYMEKHALIHRQPGLGHSTLLQKLRDSGQMVNTTANHKRIGGKNLSCHDFYYDKLGIDLLAVTEYMETKRGIYQKNGNQAQHPAPNTAPGATPDINSFFEPEKGEKESNQPGNDDLPF